MTRQFPHAFLLAPLAGLLIAAAPTAPPKPANPLADTAALADKDETPEAGIARAALLLDTGKTAEALALLDPLLAAADLPADKGRIQGLRSFALARQGKLAEARAAIEQAVDSAMTPGLLLLRQQFVLRTLTGDAAAAGQALQYIAVSNPKWLAELPSDLVSQVLRGNGEDDERQFDLAFTLVSAGYAPPEWTVGDGDTLKLAVIAGLAKRGRLEEAQPIIDGLVSTVSIARLAIDRRYQSLWPALEARLGPGADLADDAFVKAAEKALAARPQSVIALMGVAEALNIASKEPEALARIIDIGTTPDALARLNDREIWVINLKAALLADAGRTDEALKALDAVAALPVDTYPNALAFRILAADVAEDSGRHADALARAAGADSPELNDFARQALAAIKVCALARLGRTPEATAALAALPAGWTKDGNNRAVQAALACAGRMDAAAALLIKRLENEDSRDDVLFDLQPFLINDRPDGGDKAGKASLRALKARPDVKAAFAKWGRDLPPAVSPPR